VVAVQFDGCAVEDALCQWRQLGEQRVGARSGQQLDVPAQFATAPDRFRYGVAAFGLAVVVGVQRAAFEVEFDECLRWTE
jgi:hypothetical protein